MTRISPDQQGMDTRRLNIRFAGLTTDNFSIYFIDCKIKMDGMHDRSLKSATVPKTS